MIQRIKAGKHRPGGLNLPRFSKGVAFFSFSFSESCLLPSEHTNKLCGLSYRLLPKVKRYRQGDTKQEYLLNRLWRKLGFQLLWGHHYSSLRIGWRAANGWIELTGYGYREGQRVITYLGRVEPGVCCMVFFRMSKPGGTARLTVTAAANKIGALYTQHKVRPGYVLGPYWGGRERAPETLYFQLEQL